MDPQVQVVDQHGVRLIDGVAKVSWSAGSVQTTVCFHLRRTVVIEIPSHLRGLVRVFHEDIVAAVPILRVVERIGEEVDGHHPVDQPPAELIVGSHGAGIGGRVDQQAFRRGTSYGAAFGI